MGSEMCIRDSPAGEAGTPCALCRPGRYRSSTMPPVQCVACEAGTYADAEGASGCTTCQPQSTTPRGRGSTRDADCECQQGYYAFRDDDDARLVCAQCPPRSTTLHGNASGPDACVCANGFWRPESSAEAQDLLGDAIVVECLPCPDLSLIHI